MVRLPGIKAEQARRRLVRRPFFGFLNEVIDGMSRDGASEVVGAIAYYTVLSLFPLLLGVISLMGFFLPAETVQDRIFDFVETHLPAAEELLRINIDAVIHARGTLGIFSIVGLFWSSSAMFGAIHRSVNRAWGLNVRHPYHVRKLREVVQSLSSCVFFYIAIATSAVAASFSLGSRVGILLDIAVYIAMFVLVFFIFLLIYKTVPGTKTYWRYVWPGALFAAVAFEAARVVMVIYLSNFSRFELVYGTVGSIIILLVFAFWVAFILIVGAEISSEYSRLKLGLPSRPRFPPDLCQK